MANVKITDLAAYTNPASTDVLPIVDVGTDVTKKVSVGEIVGKISGDVTVGTDGTAAITGGVIVNADVNGSAAVAGTKIDPDFGSQTVKTTGVINAGSGTEAAPSVSVGTTDNGLYSPGVDQVAISTNGTERVEFGTGEVVFNDGGADYDFRIEGDTEANLFFVDASTDRVGLGTSSPGEQLELGSGNIKLAAVGRIFSTDGTRGSIQISAPNDQTLRNVTYGNNYYFDSDGTYKQDATSIGGSLIEMTAPNDNYGTFKFIQKQDPDAGGATRDALIIDSSGNVGIGTTSPGSALEIDAAAATSPFIAKINTSEVARIDSSGRLLIGTSTSRGISSTNAGNLQLEVAGSQVAASLVNNYAGVTGAILSLGHSRSSSIGSNTVLQADDYIGELRFAGADGTDIQTNAASIAALVDGTPGANDMPGRLVFSTTADGASSPTERMRISSDDYVSFSATAHFGGTTPLPVDGTSSRSEIFGRLRSSSSDSTSTRAHNNFYNPNGLVGSIATTGSATAYNTSSDYRLKENVVPLTGAADRLNQLQVHRFNFIADPDTTVDGFIAHEAQAVVPECVTGTKDEVDDEGKPVYQGIDQSKMVPLAVAAIQECIKRIEALETELALLKNGN